MIISRKHKFIFVAVPKTGTHSVRRALREQMGPDDLEQVRLFVDMELTSEPTASTIPAPSTPGMKGNCWG